MKFNFILIFSIILSSCASNPVGVRLSFYDDVIQSRGIEAKDGANAAFDFLQKKYRDGEAYLRDDEKVLLFKSLGEFAYIAGKLEVSLNYFSRSYSDTIDNIEMKNHIRKTSNTLHNNLEVKYDKKVLKYEFPFYRPALQIIKVAPVYPQEAFVNGLEGYVVLKYTVTTNGEVSEISVVEAEPKGVFEQAAISALNKQRYRPTIINGVVVDNQQNRQKFSFYL